MRTYLYFIADLERPVKDDHDAAENIFQDVLRGETHGNSDGRSSRDQGLDGRGEYAHDYDVDYKSPAQYSNYRNSPLDRKPQVRPTLGNGFQHPVTVFQ